MSSTLRATHDPLTGLPNRVLLTARIRDALIRTGRHGGIIAVLFVDMDDFATVNDTDGHDMGDQLLVVTAQRLNAVAGDADTIARLGGDQFVLLAEDIVDVDGAMRLAEQAGQAVREPVRIGDDTIHPTASIGVVYAIDGNHDSATLLSNAEAAMHEAKQAGRDRIEVFDLSIMNRLQRQLDIESELRQAIEHDQLRAHFQPILDLGSGLVWGVEALLRWEHPRRGLLVADEFMPFAGGTGLATHVDDWMLEAACRQGVSWAETLGIPLQVNVNVSALHLIDPALPGRVAEVVRATRVEPERIWLEVTETAVISHPDLAAVNLAELRQLGVRVALDDYRIGYTSLAHLQNMPLAAIKIDPALTAGLGSNPTDTVLVASTIALAKDLGLQVLANGVDTAGQRALLETLGCDLAQGSLLGHPVPPDQLEIPLGDSLDEGASAPSSVGEHAEPAPARRQHLTKPEKPVVERLATTRLPDREDHPSLEGIRVPGASEDGKSFTWLHLSDFHVGSELAEPIWSDEIEDLLMEDLATVLDRTGPIDAVFITGDVTQQGRGSEFEQFDVLVNQLVSALSSEEPPVFLAVPGNHDLSRPHPDSEILRRMRDWGADEGLRRQFWQDPRSEGRQAVATAFRNWTDWAGAGIDWSRLVDVARDGVLPGDFAATIDKGAVRIGVLGLNSAALQLAAGDYQGRLSLHGTQASELVSRLEDWVDAHDACFLLTHHEETWLDHDGRSALRGDIALPGRFDAHLCGHRHEQMRTLESAGDVEGNRTIIGRSLFGMDWYGDQKTRRHGYSIGSVRFEPEGRIFRLWPRWNASRPREGTPLLKVDDTDSTDGWATPPEQLGPSPRLRRFHGSAHLGAP